MTGIRIEGATAPPPTPSTDAAVVAGLVARDRAAVAELYDLYGDRLLGFCTGMLRDAHEAADALHDTILVAADRAEQLRDPERLRPWLYAIARTQCLARLRRRERTLLSEDPTELAEGRPVSAEDGDGARAVEGGEAAELVWSAAEGLDEGDRVLLELHLRQGLQGAELAAAAGVRPGQISMATGRMRERLERALGALLVARHGRRDCAELDGILREWDGRLTVLMRKRVARHIECCTVCDDRRSGLVAPLGSLAVGGPLLLAAPDLRTQVIGAVDRLWGGSPTPTSAPDVADGWDADGFPRDPHHLAGAATDEEITRRRRRAAVVAVAAALLLVAGLVAWRATTDRAQEVRADATETQSDDAAGPASSGAPGDAADATEPADPTTTTSAPATSAPATVPAAPTPTTAPGDIAGPPGTGDPAAGPTSVPGDAGTGGSGDGGTGTGGGSTGGGGSGGGVTLPPTTAPPPADRPPSITSVQVPTDLFTACGSPNTGTVTVQTADPDGPAGLVVAFRVDGPDGVATPAAQPLGGGRFRTTIGPFSALGPVSVRVTVTDPSGASDTETRSVPLQLAPC